METEKPPVRPTKAVVVKALRDMLRPVIEDLTVLDLFAGTGRVHEALLDEGAERAYAVDTREEPEEREDRIWFRQSVEEFLEFGPPTEVEFVFMDPPYEAGLLPDLLDDIVRQPWLRDEALVGVESSALEPLNLPERLPGGFVRIRDRSYGKSRLSLYQGQREEDAEPETFQA